MTVWVLLHIYQNNDSTFNPTRIIGTFGAYSLSSFIHFSRTFWNEFGSTRLKHRMNTFAFKGIYNNFPNKLDNNIFTFIVFHNSMNIFGFKKKKTLWSDMCFYVVFNNLERISHIMYKIRNKWNLRLKISMIINIGAQQLAGMYGRTPFFQIVITKLRLIMHEYR